MPDIKLRVLGWLRVNRRLLVFLSVMLIIIIVLSALSVNFTNKSPKRNFYVGVELAYGNDFNTLKVMVDQVKDYTNVFVFGVPELTFNRTLLDQSCDYIYSTGLHFIVLFTNVTQYSVWGNYTPAQWTTDAMRKYGDKFLAVYRWDEPGGDQIDASRYQLVTNITSSYSEVANNYVSRLGSYLKYFTSTGQTVLTADYELYWFDYKAGYNTVLCEFGWNNSRPQQIALCRGAARANNMDWGAMMTWTYNQSPYIESASKLYDDLMLAYNSGAKYEIVFSYPNITQCGILTDEHLQALKNFWNYVSNNAPTDPYYERVQTAYVLPADYGFGFRSATDRMWGLWGPDSLSGKVWNDTTAFVTQYGTNFDIVFDEEQYKQSFMSHYDKIVYWNQTG